MTLRWISAPRVLLQGRVELHVAEHHELESTDFVGGNVALDTRVEHEAQSLAEIRAAPPLSTHRGLDLAVQTGMRIEDVPPRIRLEREESVPRRPMTHLRNQQSKGYGGLHGLTMHRTADVDQRHHFSQAAAVFLRRGD